MLLKGNRIVYETNVIASRGTATYVVALNADQVIKLEDLCERLGLKSWPHQKGLVVATGRAGAARINAAAARQGITLSELRPWSPVLAMIEAAGTS